MCAYCLAYNSFSTKFYNYEILIVLLLLLGVRSSWPGYSPSSLGRIGTFLGAGGKVSQTVLVPLYRFSVMVLSLFLHPVLKAKVSHVGRVEEVTLGGTVVQAF